MIWGVLLGLNLYSSLSPGLSSSGWPTVDAQVVSHTVFPEGQTAIRSSYEVDKQLYNTRVPYSFWMHYAPHREEYSKWIKDHPVGSNMLIHYDRTNPKDVVYKPGFEMTGQFLSGAALAAFLVSSPFLLAAIVAIQTNRALASSKGQSHV